jgi:hypothetical protein
MSDTVVAIKQEAPAPLAQSATESAALISMIERAARDPDVDIAKMERLFEMSERVRLAQSKSAYLTALATMQAELPIVGKRGTINGNEKDNAGNKTGKQVKMTSYAKYEDVVEAIRPVLAKHGFSLSFRMEWPSPDRVKVTGVLGHAAGHSEETSMSLSIDNTGAKNNVQGWGSSVSYGKRYTAFALLNIAARDEDNDGNTLPQSVQMITQVQAEQLKKLTHNEAKFCQFFGIDKIENLPSSKFDEAMAKLKQFRMHQANKSEGGQ